MAKPYGYKITIKTAQRTFKPKDAVSLHEVIMNEIEKKAYSSVSRNLARSFKRAREEIYGTLAIFFQRVCSRTPLDEDYLLGMDENGKEIWHIADKNQCRMDWFIENGENRIFAKDMYDEFPDIFDKFDDKEAIEEIKDMLTDRFGETNRDFKFVVGNYNNHFDVLEYGGKKENIIPFDVSDSEIKMGELYEHGVKNYHSVQAPVGMQRITEAELRSKAIKYSQALQRKYDSMNVEKEPSDAELEALIPLLKKKRINYGDISRFIRNYQ